MLNFCNIGRGRMCYLILAISIGFFLTSVCTYAVLAVTKEEGPPAQVIKKKMDDKPDNSQKIILKRLKRLEDRMNKRKMRIIENKNNE